MNLTQIYQNNGLITTDGLINPSLISYTNPELLQTDALFNAMCTDDDKSQLFPQVLPNTTISIPTTSYLNDTLNPLSAVNIGIPPNTDIPVTLNTTNLNLPTVTLPPNSLELSNNLNLNAALATTAGLDLNALQSLSPLALNGPLAFPNTNAAAVAAAVNTPSLINTVASTPIKTETTTTTSSSSSSSSSSVTPSTTTSTSTTSSTTSTTTSTTTANAPLSATLDLSSIKSSVSETLQLTKKLSQANSSALKEGKTIDVTDILKSDVAASCLNLLKGSKGKPGRKKKCVQNSSENNTSTSTTSASTPATVIDEKKTFPLLSALNNNNDNNGKNTTNAPAFNPLVASSVKFPIIKPKSSSTDSSHKPILPLVPATTKSNSVNCFSTPLGPKAAAPKPILPNDSTDKPNANANPNPVKTAYQKRQERLLKNREAAHLSRKRKREQLHMLETHAQELIAENQTLKLKVIELEQLNEKLVKENNLLKMKMDSTSVNIKKEPHNPIGTATTTTTIGVGKNDVPNDIYNLYIKSEAVTTTPSSGAQNKNKTKEMGIVFMVLLFSFSLFTFPLSMFTSKNTEVNTSLISSFMNKISDFSLASISSENTGKVLSSTYESEKPFLLDGGYYEIDDTQPHQDSTSDLEVRDVNTMEDEINTSQKMKSSNDNKAKVKRNGTQNNIKKNYEYTSFNEISSLMSVFHPENVDLDDEALKQMSQLQQWIVEGFCNVHENHTYDAKDPSKVKDIIKVYNTEEKNQGSSIKLQSDTTYFYSPKLVQLFPLTTTESVEPSSVPIINRLQPNDTVEAIVDRNNTTNLPQEEGEEEIRETKSSSESQDNDNVYHLPFTNKPKMAIITNLKTGDINEKSKSYLMIDFEIKGARLIEK